MKSIIIKNGRLLQCIWQWAFLALYTFFLISCGGGGGGSDSGSQTKSFTVGGTVTGLASSRQLTLLNNTGDALTVTANGSFSFVTPVANNGGYSVTVGTQPYSQLCTVTNGVGTNVMASVSSVAVDCVAGVVSTLTLPQALPLPSVEGMAVSAASGNIYASDAANNVILKITPDGVVTTLAGSGTAGYANGTGAAAQFNHPIGLAVDSNENVYVADSNNQVIRMITPAGVVSLYAGVQGSSPAIDVEGPLTTATFRRPNGIAIDANNNFYITVLNQKVRKITPQGIVSTYASMTGIPYGVAVDSSGVVYVSNYTYHTVSKIAADGTITTIAGTSGSAGYVDGLGSAARFYEPWELAVDTFGTLYVADSSMAPNPNPTNIIYPGHSIRKITPDGNVTTLAGSGANGYADGIGAVAMFNTPKGLAIDSGGSLYVGDSKNMKIRVIK